MAFTERTTSPVGEYSRFYNNSSAGGDNGAITGYPTQTGANVLANCVGYANGRFAEIIGGFTYQFTGNANTFTAAAANYGLTVDTTPEVGAIMCWNSASYGHVAVVEQVIDNDTVIASESNYGATTTARIWQRVTRYRSGAGGVPWAQYTDLTEFMGFIHNPSIEPPVTYYTLSGLVFLRYSNRFGGGGASETTAITIPNLGDYEEGSEVTITLPPYYYDSKTRKKYIFKEVTGKSYSDKISTNKTFTVTMNSDIMLQVYYDLKEYKWTIYGNSIYRMIGAEL